MSYMNQVAEMLGIKLNKPFKAGLEGTEYILTDTGLFRVMDATLCCSILNDMLAGRIGYKTIER